MEMHTAVSATNLFPASTEMDLEENIGGDQGSWMISILNKILRSDLVI